MFADAQNSVVLVEAREKADSNRISFGALLQQLGRDSLGVVVLVAGVVGMAPGVSVLCGVFLVFCALEIIRGRDGTSIPAFVSGWSVPSRHVAYVLRRTAPLLVRIETRRERARPLPRIVRRAVAVPILFLSLTLFVPLPLTNVMPAAVIGAIAYACLAESRTLLCASLVCAAASLGISAVAVSALVSAGSRLI